MSPTERRERLLEWMSDPRFPSRGGDVRYVYRYSGGWNHTGLGPEYRDMAQARYDLNALEREGKVRRLPGRPARWEVVR